MWRHCNRSLLRWSIPDGNWLAYVIMIFVDVLATNRHTEAARTLLTRLWHEPYMNRISNIYFCYKYKNPKLTREVCIPLVPSSLVPYSDVIMGPMASQITSLTIVYSTVYSGANQRKHQSSTLLAFGRGIHQMLVNSPHKWPVKRKMIPFDDALMGFVESQRQRSV